MEFQHSMGFRQNPRELMEEGKVLIFSLVATQPNISLESTWSLPGVRLPFRWTHLEGMDSTSEHRELLINPAGVQMESSQINNSITIVVII